MTKRAHLAAPTTPTSALPPVPFGEHQGAPIQRGGFVARVRALFGSAKPARETQVSTSIAAASAAAADDLFEYHNPTLALPGLGVPQR